MERKILITGGAGYIGSVTARHFAKHGYTVYVLDDLRAGHPEAVLPPCELVRGSIGDYDLARSLLSKGIHGVVHFAASLSVPESVRHPLLYWENNLSNTVVLLKAMQACGVKRILFSSTAATYGVPQRVPIAEDDPKDPINPYGLSKLAMERAIETCVHAYGFGGSALRYFNAAGASMDGKLGEDHHPEEHLIPVTLEVARGVRPYLQIFGSDFPTRDGTCERDFIHVDDLAEAHRLAFEAVREGAYSAYNVGTGKGTTVRELVEAARKVTGKSIEAREAPRRAGDPPVLVADPAKIMSELGFSPKFSTIENILSSAWHWHCSHPKGYGATERR